MICFFVRANGRIPSIDTRWREGFVFMALWFVRLHYGRELRAVDEGIPRTRGIIMDGENGETDESGWFHRQRGRLVYRKVPARNGSSETDIRRALLNRGAASRTTV